MSLDGYRVVISIVSIGVLEAFVLRGFLLVAIALIWFVVVFAKKVFKALDAVAEREERAKDSDQELSKTPSALPGLR